MTNEEIITKLKSLPNDKWSCSKIGPAYPFENINNCFIKDFPELYKSIIKIFNGGRFIGNGFDVGIWDDKDFIEFRGLAYNYTRDFPDMIFFGGEDEIDLYFDPDNILGKGNWAVYCADRSSSSYEYSRYIASSINEMFEKIFNDINIYDEDYLKNIDFFKPYIENANIRKSDSNKKLRKKFNRDLMPVNKENPVLPFIKEFNNEIYGYPNFDISLDESMIVYGFQSVNAEGLNIASFDISSGQRKILKTLSEGFDFTDLILDEKNNEIYYIIEGTEKDTGTYKIPAVNYSKCFLYNYKDNAVTLFEEKALHIETDINKTRLLIITEDYIVKVYSLDDKKFIYKIKLKCKKHFTGKNETSRLSNDGKYLIGCDGQDIKIFDINKKKCIKKFSIKNISYDASKPYYFDFELTKISIHPELKFIATFCGSTFYLLENTSSDFVKLSLNNLNLSKNNGFNEILFTPDGNYIIYMLENDLLIHSLLDNHKLIYKAEKIDFDITKVNLKISGAGNKLIYRHNKILIWDINELKNSH